MAWLALQLELPASAAEIWSDALLAAGAISVDLADARAGSAEESPLFDEPGENAFAAWPYSRLTALFAAHADVPALMARLGRELAPSPDYRIAPVSDQDWVRATQQQFEPIAISERLWIVPSWRKPPRPDAVNLMVDPGLAFGTGSHPTTRLCLQWLEATVQGGERVLDYGCGSGILAIAASKLGAAEVCGVDIDPQALAASRHNARRNNVSARFELATKKLSFEADLLVANILANPLRLLAGALAQHVAARGRIVLSGILPEQAEQVLAAYGPWFDIAPWRQDEGWVALAGGRR